MDDEDCNPYRSPSVESTIQAELADTDERAVRRANGLLALAGALGLCLAMITMAPSIRDMSRGEFATCLLLTCGFAGSLAGAGLTMTFVIAEWPRESSILPMSLIAGVAATIAFAIIALY